MPTKHKSYSWNFPGTSHQMGSWGRDWETQPPPFVAALPYTWTKSETVSWYDSRGYPYFTVNISLDRSTALALSSAYGHLTGQLSDPSQWANNLLEAHGAIGQLAGHLGTLAKFAGALRKGHFGDAASALGIPNPMSRSRGKPFTDYSSFPRRPPNPSRPSSVGAAKAFGDAWLEYHFGWAPLCQDIGNSVNTMQKADFGSRRVRGNAADHFRGYDSMYGSGNTSGSVTIDSWTIDVHVKMGGHFVITNPNAYLANQMGFVNPLSVAWEAMPYSFVVDWFSNVGQVISSMTDFVGLSLHGAYTTVSQEGWRSYFNTDNVLSPPYNASYGGRGHAVSIRRIAGISGPSLVLKPFKGFSLARGATACALLLQHL